MGAPLNIYAGPKALRQIQQHGFKAHLFHHFLGASGGPKWFVLAGLDRVIFPELFLNSAHRVNVIGSVLYKKTLMRQSIAWQSVTRPRYTLTNPPVWKLPTKPGISFIM